MLTQRGRQIDILIQTITQIDINIDDTDTNMKFYRQKQIC
jgi:hypothetical protein